MLGGRERYTGLHLDWTQAWNRAFAVARADVRKKLAEWLFIAPWAIEVADEYLRKHIHSEGLQSQIRIHLSGEALTKFMDYMNPRCAMSDRDHGLTLVLLVFHTFFTFYLTIKLAPLSL